MRLAAATLCLSLMSAPTLAALQRGTKAPDFATTGSVGGKEFKLNLKDQLKKGPVVLYFFPKAFTEGCTLEARAFSQAMPEFKKAGAQVIGLSADDLPTLKRFSKEECRDAFPVATATPEVIKAYDVVLKQKPSLTSRTSYVIARDGRIVMVHDDLKWNEHVSKSLAAVRSLKR
ncbi:peroxiredoxin [Sphingomonas sp. HDW15A]|uniref:peroxiredoxin n=1 Tax=Sphingomonas sp. HDW15A TaxID=2714942 RepID=UPI00140B8DEC|nr:peroxiredoxin [Sphingomonas sp. HDW15A]QIK96922.1 peroxiredoxin [Sphingomonas sp. HDW15A]